MLSALRYPTTAAPAPAPAAPLRCLVVDGDSMAAAALAACVRQVPALALAGSYTNPEQALAHLLAQPVDVLFLPIELPLLAGLRLLRPQGAGPAVVLTSTYPDYSLQRYGSYGVVDYLPKPISSSRFQQVAARLVLQRPATVPAMAGSQFAPPQADGLYFWLKQQLVQLRLADLLYVEDLSGCTRIKTLHQEFLTDEPFAALADQLPEPQFLRVNPTCAVALRHATPVASNTLAVGGRRIMVGPALQDEVLARVFQTSLWGA